MLQNDRSSTHLYQYVLIGIAAAAFAVQIAALGPLRENFWGLHLYSFLPPVVAVAAWVLVVAAGLLTLGWSRSIGRLVRPAADALEARPIVTAVGFSLICASLFWFLRVDHLFLGDGLPLQADISTGKDFHPRQPLTMWLQHALYQYIGPVVRGAGIADGEVARRVIAMGSVLCGAMFAALAVAMGRLFVRRTDHNAGVSWLIALILVAQGYTLLFYGYIENYTYYAASLALYIYFGVRFFVGRGSLLAPGLTLVVALGLHLSAAVLVPSFVVLAAWGVAQRDRRKTSVMDLAICIAVFIAAQLLLLRIWNYDLLRTLLDVSGRALAQEGELIPGYILSLRHVRDFVNGQYLIGPLALFVFLPAAVLALRFAYRRRIGTIFFVVLGGSYLVAVWLAGDSNLGYARNWDLLAPAGICFCAAALYFMVHQMRPSVAATRLLVFGVIISWAHLVPWVWINHNEALAARRFETLPLGLGRTEVVMGNWHLRNDRRGEAVRWFEKAVAVYPNSAPAYGFLGMMFAQEERYDEAATAYDRAVFLRPDKREFRHNYTMALLELGRDEEALPHLEILGKDGIAPETYWLLMVDVLLRLGRADEAAYPYEQLLRLAEARLEVDPESPAGLLNMASALINLGRHEEARPLLLRFLELHPDHPRAAWVGEQLAQ